MIKDILLFSIFSLVLFTSCGNVNSNGGGENDGLIDTLALPTKIPDTGNVDLEEVALFAEYISQYDSLEFPFVLEHDYDKTAFPQVGFGAKEYGLGYFSTSKYRAMVLYKPVSKDKKFAGVRTFDVTGEPIDSDILAFYYLKGDTTFSASAEFSNENGEIEISFSMTTTTNGQEVNKINGSVIILPNGEIEAEETLRDDWDALGLSEVIDTNEPL